MLQNAGFTALSMRIPRSLQCSGEWFKSLTTVSGLPQGMMNPGLMQDIPRDFVVNIVDKTEYEVYLSG
jgi:hypothetical protein